MPKKTRVKLKVTEMRDAQVDFVSLVERASNRIPFRIKKSAEETQMAFNLSSITRAFKGEKAPEPAKNQIVGIATPALKGEKLEAVKAILVENGFAVDNQEELSDGSMVFKQEGFLADDPDASLVRMSQDMVLVMKGFEPYSSSTESDFLVSAKAKGFYAGLDGACTALTGAVWATLRETSSVEETSTAVATILADFSVYVQGLVDTLPQKAFKADLEVFEKLQELGDEAEPVVEPVVEPEAVAAVAAEGEEAAAAEEPTPAVEPAPAEEPASTEAVKSDQFEMPEAFTKQMQAMSEAVVGLTTAIKAVKDEQAQLKETVDGVARKAEHTSKALGTVVLGSAVGAETATTRTEAKKEDADPRSGAFDTAFLPRKQ